MDNFLEWIKKSDIELDNLEATKYAGGGWCLCAQKDFRPSDKLMRIPRRFFITAEVVVKLYGDCIELCQGVLSPFDALVLFICCERHRGESSKWAPYIRILPQTFTTPISYSDFPVSALPSSIQGTFLDQKTEVRNRYKKVALAFSLWKEAECVLKWNDFMWGWNVVNTRCLYMETERPHPWLDNASGDCLVIVPFFDLLNHSTENRVECRYVKATQCYELTAERCIMEGQEVCVSYGPHSNDRLLLDYGFVLPENGTNVVHLTTGEIVRLSRQIGLDVTERHEKALEEAGLNCSIYETQDEPTWNLLGSFYVASMTEKQLDNWRSVFSVGEFEDNTLKTVVKSALSLLITEIKESAAPNFQKPVQSTVPAILRPMVDHIWRDHYHIINQCIEQITESMQ